MWGLWFLKRFFLIEVTFFKIKIAFYKNQDSTFLSFAEPTFEDQTQTFSAHPLKGSGSLFSISSTLIFISPSLLNFLIKINSHSFTKNQEKIPTPSLFKDRLSKNQDQGLTFKSTPTPLSKINPLKPQGGNHSHFLIKKRSRSRYTPTLTSTPLTHPLPTSTYTSTHLLNYSFINSISNSVTTKIYL